MLNEEYVDYYKFLGVPYGADVEQIKSAYKKILIECHPDNQYPTEEEKNNANQKLETAKNALDTLTGDGRKTYDEDYRRKTGNFGHKNNTQQNEDYRDIFKSVFGNNPFNFDSFNFNTRETESENNFDEIISLEEEIEKGEHELKIIESELDRIKELWNRQNKENNLKVREFEGILCSKLEYIEARSYVDKFKRKDQNKLTTFLITKKQYEQYQHYCDVLKIFDDEIKEFKLKLEKALDEIDKRRDQKMEELFEKRRNVGKLRDQFRSHPLYYRYKDKQKQEASGKSY